MYWYQRKWHGRQWFFSLNGGGRYQGIGLVEVAWNVCPAVEHFWLNQRVNLHDALHGFRSGMGTGTETLEAKLAQKLAGISNKLMLQVFLEVRKAFDSLNRGRYMGILRWYGMVQNTARLIDHHWDNLHFIPKASSLI